MVRERTILLVDDDAVLAELYRVKFARAGFQVLLASDGQKAIDVLIQGARPDIILLDIVMPHMDGFGFLQEAKHKELRLPPVIVLTSQQDDIDKIKAFAFGANHFVQKATATPKDVLQTIEVVLAEKEKANALK